MASSKFFSLKINKYLIFSVGTGIAAFTTYRVIDPKRVCLLYLLFGFLSYSLYFVFFSHRKMKFGRLHITAKFRRPCRTSFCQLVKNSWPTFDLPTRYTMCWWLAVVLPAPVLHSMPLHEVSLYLLHNSSAEYHGINNIHTFSSGLSTALVELDDFSSGTSSRSTKLIHGGVRYLQKAIMQLDIDQYRMVREAVS